jgi:hypothetical protein
VAISVSSISSTKSASRILDISCSCSVKARSWFVVDVKQQQHVKDVAGGIHKHVRERATGDEQSEEGSTNSETKSHFQYYSKRVT